MPAQFIVSLARIAFRVMYDSRCAGRGLSDRYFGGAAGSGGVGRGGWRGTAGVAERDDPQDGPDVATLETAVAGASAGWARSEITASDGTDARQRRWWSAVVLTDDGRYIGARRDRRAGVTGVGDVMSDDVDRDQLTSTGCRHVMLLHVT